MDIKALIFDLDNTIYPVSSITANLFEPLFTLIKESGEYIGDLEAIKQLTMRKPFQYVADKHDMSSALREKCLHLLSNLTYDKTIQPFPYYNEIRKLPQDKYLVTAGFTKLQWSKINQLGIENDFEGIHIIDPLMTDDSKKTAFKDIMAANNYHPQQVLVIGDDPESEIEAARQLGMNTVLFDSLGLHQNFEGTPRITGFTQLDSLL